MQGSRMKNLNQKAQSSENKNESRESSISRRKFLTVAAAAPLMMSPLMQNLALAKPLVAQEDLSVILGSETQDFLKKPICSKNTIQKNYTDFVGERIPPLILPSSKKEWEKRAEKIRKKLLSEVFLKNVPKKWIDESFIQ